MLTRNEIEARSPAVYVDHHHMSDRYVQIPTFRVMEELATAGYHPIAVQQDKPQKRNPLHVTHIVTMRHESHIGARKVGETVPQILLMNSHNGRTKMRMMAGFYRMVCSNGLIVGKDMFRYEISHWGDALAEALGFAEMMGEEMGQLEATINRWKSVKLTEARAHTFAQRAAEMRYGDTAINYTPQAILEAHRTEDQGRSLWQVYNVVQENTVSRGITGMNAVGRVTRTRPLTQIVGNVAYNSDLWNLAEEFAEAA